VKSTKTDGVITAVRVVAEGGAYFDPAVAHIVLRKVANPDAPSTPAASPLSPRETEILKLIADGVGNAEIAERLSIGLGTVKGHVRDILEKLSAADRTQAAVVALRRGII
jgi:DNA-binding NarL/FixJ family response regulator